MAGGGSCVEVRVVAQGAAGPAGPPPRGGARAAGGAGGARGGEVRYKPEGGRFGHARATLKLVAGEPYLLCLRVTGAGGGARQAGGVGLKLRCQPPGPGGGVGCVEEQTLKAEPSSEGRLMAAWVCPLEPCQKQERALMWLDIEAGGQSLEIPLLAKVYRSRRAVRGGSELKAVLCKFGEPPATCAPASLESQKFL